MSRHYAFNGDPKVLKFTEARNIVTSKGGEYFCLGNGGFCTDFGFAHDGGKISCAVMDALSRDL